MEKKATYEVWNAVAYGYGEPLVPFRQVGVFDTLQQVQIFVDSSASVYFVLDEDMNILFKTDECNVTDIDDANKFEGTIWPDYPNS